MVVRDLVSQVYNMLNVQLALKPNVTLSYEVNEDVPEIIQSDFQRLKQILINILRNSTKFTNQGRIEIRVSCSTLQVLNLEKLMEIVEAV